MTRCGWAKVKPLFEKVSPTIMHRQLGLWDPVAAQVEGEKVGRRDPKRAWRSWGHPHLAAVQYCVVLLLSFLVQLRMVPTSTHFLCFSRKIKIYSLFLRED